MLPQAHSVVPDEATGVAEAPIGVPAHVAVDQLVLDGAALCADGDKTILDRVAAPKGLVDTQHQLLVIRAELHDRLPNVLVSSAAQCDQPGLVGPKNVTSAGTGAWA